MAADNAGYRIVEGQALLDLIPTLSHPTADGEGLLQIECENPDGSIGSIPLDPDDDLPPSSCGWRLFGATVFFESASQHFPPAKVAASTEGPDELQVELLADRVRHTRMGTASRTVRDALDGVDLAPDIVLRGHVCVVEVEGQGKPWKYELAHLSKVDAVGLSWVSILPGSADHAEHPRLPDGRRIVGLQATGLAPQLLRYLAARPAISQAPATVLRFPMVNASFLPSIPTRGESKRRKQAEQRLAFQKIMATRNATRVPVSLVVQLDEASMRLASASRDERRHRLQRRQASLQLRLACPEITADDSDEQLQRAVEYQLQHFDTDYMLSFDAICALASMSNAGVVIDDAMHHTLARLRFGSTRTASAEQRRRIQRHVETLMAVRIEVRPQNGDSKSFRGPILLRALEVFDEVNPMEPLKVGDCVVLNPLLFGAFAEGKGMYADPRYLLFDPYRQDWMLRLYRYFAARWSASSTALARSGWEVRQNLVTTLDMAGIEWRTMIDQDRGRPEVRRRIEQALDDLQADGMFGPWRIDGQGLDARTTIAVAVPEAIRRAIVDRRPGLHADAARGTIERRRKALPKA